ncbi:MAG: hypothetical protein K2W78_12740 [Xanthobacteraceae bacterium]|nr:hypothetical protein [Xanthobacteraceae bacterium]
MSAVLIPFPLARTAHLVETTAARMARLPEDMANTHLRRLLEKMHNELRAVGVDDQIVEDELICFARAVRARIWHEVLLPGGAA